VAARPAAHSVRGVAQTLPSMSAPHVQPESSRGADIEIDVGATPVGGAALKPESEHRARRRAACRGQPRPGGPLRVCGETPAVRRYCLTASEFSESSPVASSRAV